MKIHKTMLVLLFAALLISACSSTEEQDLQLEDPVLVTGAESNDVSTSGYQDGMALSETRIQGIDEEGNALGGEFDDPQNPLSKQTIYFMYDSSQVQPEYLEVIRAHAKYLADNPAQAMILEGHADERGSREYNIALSEQRAKAIARMMKVHGVSPSQLRIVSYGEEKPMSDGHNESAWQLNRRVELVYQAQ